MFEYTPRTIRLLLEKCGFNIVTLEKHKIRPSLRVLNPEELAMFALELINWPATALLGVWGDRVIVCARTAQT